MSQSVWQKVRKVAQLPLWDVWEVRSDPGMGPQITTLMAYTRPEGHYVGEAEGSITNVLASKGVKPELAAPDLSVCTIGYSEREGKWYGWSHRAIYGFKIGDVVEKGDVTDETLPVGFRAKTLDDARKMAVAFARSVA